MPDVTRDPTSAPRDAPTITGRTRLVAVLGDPVEQVRAPALLNPLLAAAGADLVVVPVHVPAADLEAVVHGLQRTANLVGLLVTVPHKVHMLRLADVHSRAAELAGSTNALRRLDDGSWHADNFDGAGFVAGLREAGHPPAGRQVVLVGAGGAGSAIAAALLAAGTDRLVLHDTDRTRAEQVAARMAAHWPGSVSAAAEPDLHAADIVVNATPLGLRPGDALPFDPARMRPDALVADIIMEPRRTALLRRAADLGHPVQPGEPMLRHQMEQYLGYFGPAR